MHGVHSINALNGFQKELYAISRLLRYLCIMQNSNAQANLIGLYVIFMPHNLISNAGPIHE